MKKVYWYSKLNELISSDKYKGLDNPIIIAKDKLAFVNKGKEHYVKNYSIFSTYVEVLDYIDQKKKKHFHEIILKNDRQFMKFDIDLTYKEFENIKEYTNYDNCNKFVKDLMFDLTATIHMIYGYLCVDSIFPDVAICDSSVENEKASYHMIFRDIVLKNNESAKIIYNYTLGIISQTDKFKNIPESILTTIIDRSVYKSVQGFRIVGCNKPQKNNTKKILNGKDSLNTFICNVDKDAYCFTIDDIKIQLDIQEEVKPCQFKRFENSDIPEDKLTELTMLCDAESYYNWFRIGQILYNIFYENGAEEEEKYLTIFHNYSSKSHKYDEDETAQLWSNFRYKNNDEKKLTIGTMIMLAKENDIEGFDIWKNKYKNKNHNLDDDIKYFQDWRKLIKIKNIKYEDVVEYCKRTFAFVFNGGNGFWITKNYKDEDIHFEILKNLCGDSLDITFTNSSNVSDDGEIVENKFQLVQVLKSLKQEIAYDYFDFIPYSPTQIKNDSDLLNKTKNIFNLFTGFKATPIWDLDGYYNDYYKKVDILFSHIKNIWCKGNEKAYEYILDWLAYLFQYPNKKIGIMIVLKSIKQGAGKNIIFDFIRDYVYGQKYCLEINNMEQLTGKFNSLLQNKLLTLADEVGMFGTDHRNSDKLKNIITQPKQNIERKGMDSFKINDYNNFIALTNNDWAFKIEAGDRRHICLELSNEKVGDDKYFNKIGDCFNNECGNIFYSILLNRDISNWKKLDIPMTELKRELKLNSMPKPLLYMIDIIEGKEKINLDLQNRIHQKTLFEKFKEWLSINGYNDKYNVRRFKLDLEKIEVKQISSFTIGGIRKVGYKIDFEKMKVEIKRFLKDPDFKFMDEFKYSDLDDDYDYDCETISM